MKLEVGMYVRGKYYGYRGKIGKIVKNYNGDLEIAYQDGLLKTTVSSFIDDNYDINGKQYAASHNIIDLIEVGDYVNGYRVYSGGKKHFDYILTWDDVDNYYIKIPLLSVDIKSIVTKEQFEAIKYEIN